ncbi:MULTISPECIES: hypothetical protein [unclassified Streptomyces]|uniref:hypothetical protein n=1 Tax=unclassified Streptomyces TaxID=2593676 RepID=UPI0006FE5C7A|nr:MULTISPECIES: hypothetical protein [unclassified Streptomyces]KQX48063.1 hypothetical protein ASD33_20355 [Streptomyces sp. Root1304]KRA82455.1 hypothetical protein ASE09_15310 [Streptomyces sp. Root66D1]
MSDRSTIARKYDRAFRPFDVDGNGVIEKKDFDLLADAVLRVGGIKAGTAKEPELHRTFHA